MKLNEILSTNGKVVLSLVILGLAAGAAYWLLGGVHHAAFSHWNTSHGPVNDIDGSIEVFLTHEASNSDSIIDGQRHYAVLIACFKNGLLCQGDEAGIYITGHQTVARMSFEHAHEASVRLKFDDETPVQETWGITDDRQAIMPYGSEKRFLAQLLQHKKLTVEFAFFEQAPHTDTFDLTGLSEKLQTEGIGEPQ